MKNTHNLNKTYETADLYYAAYLKVAGIPLLNTRRDRNRVYFIFEHSPSLQDLRSQYYNRTSKVPALTYADEIKAMKSLTYTT